MILEKTRRELGWVDFDGYVYLKNDVPVLHLYEFDGGKSKTLFWLGRTSVADMVKALPGLIRDVAAFENAPLSSFNEFSVRYAEAERMVALPFFVDAQTPDQRTVMTEHVSFLRSNLSHLLFARIDLVSELTPFSLWADLSSNASRREIGYTARVLSQSAFGFFLRTSLLTLSKAEIERLNELLEYRSEVVPA
jgi:hypothetical protein